jgi:hypothetical protein
MQSNSLARTAAIAAALFAAMPAAAPAQSARTIFDGPWSVVIVTDQGSCERVYRYGVEIANGHVLSQGSGAAMFGRVTRRGQVDVRVRQGNQEAVGSGRLTQVSGGGWWRGASPDLQCAGHWTAQRRAYY